MKKLVFLVLILAIAQWWLKDPVVKVPTNDIRFGYVVKYPAGHGRKDRLPMLVALHGNGDTADHFFDTALNEFKVPCRIILVKGPFSRGRGHSWPWTGADFAQYGKAFSEAVDLLAKKFPTEGKPVLMGFSGGGMMAYYQAVKHGDKYSSIFPISGNLSKEHLGDKSKVTSAPVFAFHGKSDSVIRVRASTTTPFRFGRCAFRFEQGATIRIIPKGLSVLWERCSKRKAPCPADVAEMPL